MRIEAIKNVNFTVLFPTPLNHLLISQKGILDLFKTGDQEKDIHTFVEVPGLKILIFPNRRKEFVFEGLRILINDKSETLPGRSDVVDNFQKIRQSSMIEQGEITAYGFNYDVIMSPEKSDFKISDLVGTKIASIAEIKSAGASILFDKGSVTYTLEIKPIGNEQKFITHFNAHFSTTKLPPFDGLKEELNSQFEEFKKIIQQI